MSDEFPLNLFASGPTTTTTVDVSAPVTRFKAVFHLHRLGSCVGTTGDPRAHRQDKTTIFAGDRTSEAR